MHTAQKENKNFILVTRDGESISGTKVSARKIIEERLDRNQWPIYENTRGRRSFNIGSNVAFYIGGASADSGLIIATAIIESIKSPKEIRVDDFNLVEDPAFLFLGFKQVKFLKIPIKFKEKLPTLSFCPANMQKWGVVLIGGCRQLDINDWNLVFS